VKKKYESLKLKSKIGSKKDNLLINGDNLSVMNEIKSDFAEKVNLIYIDVPYNTGKRMGKYKDNFQSHSNWIDFIRPRLAVAKDMMAANGIIAISVGEKEEAYLKILCNEIFGERNKISSIIWQSKYTVANDKVGISTQTEYILMYAKNIKHAKINNDPLRPEYVAAVYKNPDNDPRGLWRGGIQLFKKKNKHSYSIVSPNGKEWIKPWNYSRSQWTDVLEKNNLIYWGKDGNSCPVKKVFLKDAKGTPIKNLWLGQEVGYTADGGNVVENILGDRNDFLYPKPVKLMRRILQIASQPDSLIMDFFAGSGTMGQAVLESNKETGCKRKFILITNNENNICDNVAFPRLQKVIVGYTGKDGKEYVGTGGNLFYYKESK
jgi:adenine-specific DNA-methyltransferase